MEDIDKVSETIVAAGGKMVSDKVPEGKFGLYRYFEDTEGNVGAVYQFIPEGNQ